MRRPLFALTLCTLFALPALAAGYSFHLRVTDGRTALLANPKGAPPPEQLAEAAKSRVLLFERVKGAHFVWMMLGWPEGEQDTEYAINDAGGIKATDEKADLALAPKESGLVTVRCLRVQCRLHVTDGGDRRVDVTLNKGQSADLPMNADFDVELDR
jgi:hypothetical protein